MQQDAIIGLINKDVVIFLYLDLILVTKLPQMYYAEPYTDARELKKLC